MLGTQLTELLESAPPGTGEALDLVAGFDDCLVQGFARLGDERVAALAALAGAVAATPLGERAAEAVEKVAAGSVADAHLAALAGGRAALLGAVHDALLARLDAALGRWRAAWEEPPTPWPAASDAAPGPPDSAPPPNPDAAPEPPAAPPPGPPDPDAAARTAENLCGGARSWLHELAIAGWRGVDHDLVAAADQTLQGLLAEPGLRRLAVLLDGLAGELRGSCPVGAMEHLPVRRWADLWSRALLLSQAGGWPGAPGAAGAAGAAGANRVSGRLLVLGADVHEHGTAVQVQVHGVLETAGGDGARLVRTSVAAAKVDTIAGPALWRLLDDFPVLLGALANHRSLEVADLPMLPSGDLVWCDRQASLGEPADPFVSARVLLAGAVAPAVPPLDCHPVRIAEPVLVEGYSVTVGDTTAARLFDTPTAVTLDLDGTPLPVDLDRLPSCGPLTPERVASSSACVGLMRWDDGGWRLQPLAVQMTSKRQMVGVHNGDWALGPTDREVVKAEAKAGDAVVVLRERAGRLLRR